MLRGGGLILPKHVVKERERKNQEENIKSLANKDCKDCWGRGFRVRNEKRELCPCTQKAAAKHLSRVPKHVLKPDCKIITPYDK